ncbi:hypothetical protein ACVWZK_006924 [Bradyrhizobium sp. GM0.4]
MSQNQASSPADAKRTTAISRIVALIPGILLCIAVAGVSALLERAELGIFEHPYVEALVMAILLGMAVRSFWKPAPRWQSGIAFSAKQLLEVAVMLLGGLDQLRCYRGVRRRAVGLDRGRRCGRALRFLRHQPAAWSLDAALDPDRLRKLDLRQFGDCGGGADHRRQQ